MTTDELHEFITSWENHELIINEALNNSGHPNLLLDIALRSKRPKSWRAAWIVDKINDKKPDLIEPHINSMIIQLKKETSSSKKRHFLKLISQHKTATEHHAFLLDYCTACFTSAGEPIAVRVYALQILYNISETEPELKPELLSIIHHETELHPSAGIKSRGRKLAKKLQVEINNL
ncbi:MAG: hypothetical protein ACOC0R_01315 [Mariniphaga sp.]